MCLPAVAHFKRERPDCETHFLVAHPYADLLVHHHNYGIDHVHVYRREPGPYGWLQMASSAGRLRKLKFDAVFNWQANPRSKLLLAGVGARPVLSYNRFLRIHQLEKCYLTLSKVGITEPREPFTINLVAEPELSWAKELLDRLPTSSIPLAFGIGGLWHTKLWPIPYYRELIRNLATQVNAHFILLGDKRDLPRSQQIQAVSPGHVLNLVGATTILQASAVVHMCHLTISTDTSVMHLAWVQGKPCIGIFGATDPLRTGPLGLRAIELSSLHLPCHPCFSPICQIASIEDTRCLKRTTPDLVAQEAIRLLLDKR